MHEGSTMGLGRLAVSASKLCHCWGNPVNFCSRWSKPVWTRCSKLEGPEISSLFFFFPNMVERSGEVRGKKERKEKEDTSLHPVVTLSHSLCFTGNFSRCHQPAATSVNFTRWDLCEESTYLTFLGEDFKRLTQSLTTYVHNTLWNKEIPKKESPRGYFVFSSLLMLQVAPHGSSKLMRSNASSAGWLCSEDRTWDKGEQMQAQLCLNTPNPGEKTIHPRWKPVSAVARSSEENRELRSNSNLVQGPSPAFVKGLA